MKYDAAKHIARSVRHDNGDVTVTVQDAATGVIVAHVVVTWKDTMRLMFERPRLGAKWLTWPHDGRRWIPRGKSA